MLEVPLPPGKAGALMAALIPPSLQPLFPGANELDQISRIHDVMGSPPEKTLTKFKQECRPRPSPPGLAPSAPTPSTQPRSAQAVEEASLGVH